MIDVTLFPIPNCVAFPGTDYPLHVFEPRYRNMVQHCLDNRLPMGICHTEEVLRPAKSQQSLEEALQSNQATYRPYKIFSAGRVSLEDTLEDGRMMIQVHLEQRLKAVTEKQTLPFAIYRCEPYEDREIDAETLQQTSVLQEKLLKRLIALTSSNPQMSQLLASASWRQMDPLDFSFQLFGLLQMDGDIQQQILQCRSPLERLNIALQLLNKAS